LLKSDIDMGEENIPHPGSLFDRDTMVSPTDIRDFPCLSMLDPYGMSPTSIPSSAPTLAPEVDIPIKVTSSVNAFVSELRVLGSHNDQANLLTFKAIIQQESLSDTGSNICLSNIPHILIDVVDIPPVHVGLAVK